MSDSGFVQTNGARLYYEVEGSGHPLLMIHGGLGSLRMWDGPALAQRYQVIRFDASRVVGCCSMADNKEVLAHLLANGFRGKIQGSCRIVFPTD